MINLDFSLLENDEKVTPENKIRQARLPGKYYYPSTPPVVPE